MSWRIKGPTWKVYHCCGRRKVQILNFIAEGLKGPALICSVCKKGMWLIPRDKLEKVEPKTVTESQEPTTGTPNG